jgi:hypothetical protein
VISPEGIRIRARPGRESVTGSDDFIRRPIRRTRPKLCVGQSNRCSCRLGERVAKRKLSPTAKQEMGFELGKRLQKKRVTFISGCCPCLIGCEADHAVLGRRCTRATLNADDASARGRVDDCAASLLEDQRNLVLHAQKKAAEDWCSPFLHPTPYPQKCRRRSRVAEIRFDT